MKKITLILTTIFLIGACSQNEEMASSESQNMVEYVWHKAGPDFNAENLAMLINSWNGIIDNMDSCSAIRGANILTPEVANEGYDFIWVLLWDSQNGRDACWDDWTANQQSAWDVTINGIMEPDFDNVYLFKSTVGQSPKVENNSGQFVNRFNFCNYNDGYSELSLETFRNDIASTNWSDTYWYVLLEPTFESNSGGSLPDFVWLDLWADTADKEKAFTMYMKSEIPSSSGAAFNCNNVDFSGVAIRR